MAIAAYCRVSSRRQKADSQVSESRNGSTPTATTASRFAGSLTKRTGKTLCREAFQQLQKDIFAGLVQTVIVWKLDRLSRRLRDGVNLLCDWCEKGLRIVVVTQQIDLSGPVGRMIAAVLLGLGEIELEYRAERQAAGIEVAQKKGIYKGRKKGTTKGEPERARQLRAKGLKVSEIAQAIGDEQADDRAIPGGVTAGGRLKPKSYRGEVSGFVPTRAGLLVVMRSAFISRILPRQDSSGEQKALLLCPLLSAAYWEGRITTSTPQVGQ